MPEGQSDDGPMSLRVVQLPTSVSDPVDDTTLCLPQGLCVTTSGGFLSDNEGQLLIEADGQQVMQVDSGVEGQAVAFVDTGSAGLDLGQVDFVTDDDVSFVGSADGGTASEENFEMQQQQHVVLSADQLVQSQLSVADDAALQSLLATHGSAQLTGANGETIQIITVNGSGELGSGENGGGGGKMWQLVTSSTADGATGSGDMEATTIITVNPTDAVLEQVQEEETVSGGHETVTLDHMTLGSVHDGILMPPPPPPQNLPPGCPNWANRLRDCEQIGDSYRGWVDSEVELDLVLTFHKQQTQSFWGTRQSPSPAKQSTRLMWKSQYVPFDGIPFVNSGSRAIVMECQYGPRRKGNQLKKQCEPVAPNQYHFKQTCPARIYIKKVRKYPEFRVDLSLDKKTLKLAMDKAFQLLKEKGLDRWGQERYYVQLPTNAAHEFHMEMGQNAQKPTGSVRLHPHILQKIRDMVAGGETRLYAIRKALRRFVEKEMFDSVEQLPEKHNLSYYPTVNDLQNNIHQAVEDIETGMLPITAHMVNVEMLPSGAIAGTTTTRTALSGSNDSNEMCGAMWQSLADDQPHAETVTVTLTQNPNEDGQHVISRVETHLSDGSTQVSETLTPHTARLLTKLHPNMFPAGSLLQMQEGCMHPASITLNGQPISLNADIASHTSSSEVFVTTDNDAVMSTITTTPVTSMLTSDAMSPTFTITENHLGGGDDDEIGADTQTDTRHAGTFSDESVKLEVDESAESSVLYGNITDTTSIHAT